MLVVSARNGTTYAIWDLGFDAEDLALDIVPSGGVLPPGSNVTVAVAGTPSKQDVGGQPTINFNMASTGSARPISATNASLEVLAVFYLCPANEYANSQNDDARVSCAKIALPSTRGRGRIARIRGRRWPRCLSGRVIGGGVKSPRSCSSCGQKRAGARRRYRVRTTSATPVTWFLVSRYSAKR